MLINTKKIFLYSFDKFKEFSKENINDDFECIVNHNLKIGT